MSVLRGLFSPSVFLPYLGGPTRVLRMAVSSLSIDKYVLKTSSSLRSSPCITPPSFSQRLSSEQVAPPPAGP